MPAEKHGAWSSLRKLSPQAIDIAAALMQQRHVVESDYTAALEISELEVLIDRVDVALAGGVVERKGTLRALVDQRRRVSAQLERWQAQRRLTPQSRSQFAARLPGVSLHAEFVRRRQGHVPK
jgi:hypothetical protein